MVELWLLEIQNKITWGERFRLIYKTETENYKKTHCKDISKWSSLKGRADYTICQLKGHNHALKKGISYLKTLNPKDKDQKIKILSAINNTTKQIKKAQEIIDSHRDKKTVTKIKNGKKTEKTTYF